MHRFTYIHNEPLTKQFNRYREIQDIISQPFS